MSKSVIITGSTGNLGMIVTQTLKKQGYRVFGTTTSERGMDSLEENGIEGFQVNLSDPTSVDQLVEELEQTQTPSSAVLLAGGFAMGGIEQTSMDQLKRMISINFETTFYLVQRLIKTFESQNGGQFIMIGAKPALEAETGKHMVAYSLSKRLVFHLSDLINAHGNGINVHSTVIVPGTIDTQTNREAMPEADYSKWTSPEALATTIGFLLSKSGSEVRDSVIKLYND